MNAMYGPPWSMESNMSRFGAMVASGVTQSSCPRGSGVKRGYRKLESAGPFGGSLYGAERRDYFRVVRSTVAIRLALERQR